MTRMLQDEEVCRHQGSCQTVRERGIDISRCWMGIFIFFVSLRIISDTIAKKNTYVVDKQIRMEDSVVSKMTMGSLVKAGL